MWGELIFIATIASLGEDNGAKETLPPCIEKVQEEKKDVMPQELPRHLPPTCEVERKIKLELGEKTHMYSPVHGSTKLLKLRMHLKELFEANHIHSSKAHYGVDPVLKEER